MRDGEGLGDVGGKGEGGCVWEGWGGGANAGEKGRRQQVLRVLRGREVASKGREAEVSCRLGLVTPGAPVSCQVLQASLTSRCCIVCIAYAAGIWDPSESWQLCQ
jgi:hypothetical protein